MEIRIEVPEELARRAEKIRLDIPKKLIAFLEEEGMEFLEESIEDEEE